MIELRFVWLIESDGSRKFLCPQIPNFGYPTSEFYVKSYRYIELYQNMHYSVLSRSVEKYYEKGSRFSWNNQHFFRQINVSTKEVDFTENF